VTRFASLSLRARFLLVVLAGVVLPIAVAGTLLVRSSRNAGVELVRSRLSTELNETVQAFGRKWSRDQSALLDLAETRMVRHALGAQALATATGTPGDTAELVDLWSGISEFAWLIEVVDTGDRTVLRLPDGLGQPRADRSPPPGFLNYDVPVRERFSGNVLGTLRIRFRSDALVSTTTPSPGLTGTVLAIVDRRNGTALTPFPIDPSLFEQERFSLGNDEKEEWLALGRDVVDPPLRFALAAPLGPVLTPLEEASRRGTLVLLLVVGATFALATLFSHRLTRSLEGLSTAAAAVAAGDLDARVDETGPPAVRDTAASFNTMSATLRETLDHLSQREALAAVGEFAASLAHEVRNPLTSIRMDLERCGRKLDDEPAVARELAGRALTEIDRLNASVSDFLRIARSGGRTMEPLDLRAPLEAAVRAAQPRFAERGCVLEFDPPPDPIEVRGDAGSLEQLVLNLLLNAADASRTGGRTWLTVDTTDEVVLVTVRDEGSGVAPADQDRIFEPLYTTKGEGTGLGLSVARRVARAHGGEIEVDSTPGHGAAFSFRLRR
jgi:signal transduction histidine kinase